MLGHTAGNRIENPVYDPIPKGFKIAGDRLKKTALEMPAADIVVQALEIGGLDYLDTKLAG